ncbi:MAG: alpha/beta hydrolase [Caulobacter sp.]|nr:alpha/beta hydrolase [Caulobacter sp.]
MRRLAKRPEGASLAGGALAARWKVMMMRSLLVVVFLLGLAACASPPDLAKAPAASPPVLGAFRGDPPATTAEAWAGRRSPLLRKAFLEAIYGQRPDLGQPTVESRETLAVEDVGDATVEQWTVRLGKAEPARRFHVILALPKATGRPAPLIILELFCGNRAAVPGHPESVVENRDILPAPCRSTTLDPVAKIFFGKRINGPDIAKVTARGYAVAMFYPGEIVPDDPDLAPAALAALQPGVPAERRGGALAVWSVMFSDAYDVLTADPRLDAARTAIWGHSRHGKAALLAAAFDPRFAAVIAHQSGRGGASLTHSGAGETVKQITDAYGFWFGAAYARQASQPATDLDQHQLIALIAPRPLLLGNAMGDGWSDPAGAFRAAQGADPAYRLLGSSGFNATDMDDFRPGDGIVWWSRGGGHGVTTEDWDAFLRFLDKAMPAR